jgi:hypothetical protein
MCGCRPNEFSTFTAEKLYRLPFWDPGQANSYQALVCGLEGECMDYKVCYRLSTTPAFWYSARRCIQDCRL